MQYDFTFQNPTRIHFGKRALDYLRPELDLFGGKVLLVYGGGSVKRTGVYDQIIRILAQCGKTVRELSQVPSNPTAAKVYEGIAIAKEFGPDLILALGGGSVIDCSKAIGAGACTDRDFWEAFFLGREEPEAALPLGVILTMAGTGSEMNGSAVVTHEESKLKLGSGSDVYYPVFSILNPELTYTVPREQMVSGICDIISHILEVYMSPSDEDNLSDDLAEAILKNVIRSARRAVQDPGDYSARSNLMWGATLGLNGLLEGSKRQDWMVHQIEHQIGAYTNCPHGLGLSAISANYYRMVCPHAIDRFVRFAQNVWAVDPAGASKEERAMAGIDALEDFFREIGAATSLRELGMDESSPLAEIADSCRRLRGGYLSWTHRQIKELLQRSL